MLSISQGIIELKARDRVKALFDNVSYQEFLDSFINLESPHLIVQGIVPQSDDGVILMKGMLNHQETLVIATEGAFQGGGIGEISGAKIVCALDKALESNKSGKKLHVVVILDSGGVRLQEANYGLLAISEIQSRIVELREYIPIIGIIPGKIGCFGGMSMTAGLFSFLIATKESRITLNGPEVIEQEAGLMELDSSNKKLIWETIGGTQRYKTGFVDFLVEDDIDEIRVQINKCMEIYEMKHEKLSYRSQQIKRYRKLLEYIDPLKPLSPLDLQEIIKQFDEYGEKSESIEDIEEYEYVNNNIDNKKADDNYYNNYDNKCDNNKDESNIYDEDNKCDNNKDESNIYDEDNKYDKNNIYDIENKYNTSTSSNNESLGKMWFNLLGDNQMSLSTDILSVAYSDVVLKGANHQSKGLTCRLISIIPDPNAKFPRASSGEVGLEEGWKLAQIIKEVIDDDKDKKEKRAIVAIVDVPSQAYGYKEELLGLSQACAASVDAYISARLACHPVVSIIVGKAISGAFLAHGYQANRIIALNSADVLIHAMSEESAARITRRTVEELEKASKDVPGIAYDIKSYEKLGILDGLIDIKNYSQPLEEDVLQVKRLIADLVQDIIDSKDFSLKHRYTKQVAKDGRQLTMKVQKLLGEQWR